MKIVINKCHGGFGLSHKATMRYAELKGLTVYPYHKDYETSKYTKGPSEHSWTAYIDQEMTNPTEKEINDHWVNVSFRSEERHDPLLIQVVEELGEEANDRHSKLEIVEVPNGVNYEVQEYDGMEWIAEKHRTWG